VSDHYKTPAEAREIGCPLSMAGNPHIAHKSCLGPNCMAWRWAMQREEKIRSDGLKEYAEYSTTHGYCGIAR